MRPATFIIALLAAASHAQTVLIDYDDGVAGNGRHDAGIRNGGFEDADGTDFATTPFWESYFAEGAAEDPVLNTNTHTGALRGFASGWMGTGTRVHPAQAIPAAAWTLQQGDVLTVTLWAREGAALDDGDGGQLILHVVDSAGNAVNDAANTPDRPNDRLLQHNFGLPDDGSWTLVTATSEPLPAGSPWIGNQLRLRILAAANRDEFMIIDDVSLTAARPNPAPAVEVARYLADGDTLDAAGSNHHGTATGALAYAPGFGPGQSFALSGTEASVAIPHVIPRSFSIAFWMKTSTAGSSGTQLAWWEGDGLIDGEVVGAANDFGVSLWNHRVAFGTRGAGGNTATLFSRSHLTDHRWHHVAVTRDGGTGAMTLSIDGLLEATGSGPAGPLDAPPQLRIGALQTQARHFDGLLDDIRLYENLLTPAEISALAYPPGDTDRDGHSNAAEWAAGTDWTDPRDFFSLDLSPGTPLVLRSDGKAGRTYRFYRSTGLGPWSPLDTSPPVLSDGEVLGNDPAPPLGQAFYRATVEPDPAARPNIVVIITDDQGYADLSAYPHSVADIATPHMDRIAQGGVLLTQGYVTAPVCSPSRTGWITGRHQQEWDASASWNPGLPGTVPTIAELLSDAGYTTAAYGKSDFGRGYHSLTARENPAFHGYDTFLGFSAHAHDFWLHSAATANATPDPDGSSAHLGPFLHHDFLAAPAVNPTRQSFPDGDYLTEIITDRSIAFLDAHAASTDPFFLTVNYNSVHHLVHEVPASYLAAEGVAAIPDYDPATNTTGNPANYGAYYNRYNDVGAIPDTDMRKFYRANLACLDDNIGRLLDALDTRGLTHNTLLVFFSDNGGSPLTGANNSPLCGSKYNLFEGGIRVPFMVRWPARLPAATVYNHPVSTLDLLPTCLDATGATPPPNLRGRSLLDPLATGQPVVPGGRTLFWKWQSANWAVRKGDFKLVRSAIGTGGNRTSQVRFNSATLSKVSLFNLATDPGELTDLVDDPAYDAVQAELQALYNSWNATLP